MSQILSHLLLKDRVREAFATKVNVVEYLALLNQAGWYVMINADRSLEFTEYRPAISDQEVQARVEEIQNFDEKDKSIRIAILSNYGVAVVKYEGSDKYWWVRTRFSEGVRVDA